MSEAINIRTLAAGTRVRLTDGSLAEIVSNPADGVWLFARLLAADGAAPVGEPEMGATEMVFAQDVAEIVPLHSAGGSVKGAQ